jgi:hypothetical protein
MVYSSFICLSSTASRETFPNNSLTSFCNVLPTPLVNRERKRFYIKLKAIGIGIRAVNPATFTSSYLKIHISELEGQRQGREYTNAIGGFAFPPKEKYGKEELYGFHTFQQSSYLPIRFQTLDKLQVEITDIKNNPVLLQQAPATLLWLEITNMEGDEQFNISCLSRHPNLYPGNKLGYFTTPLPSEINLSKFEVALYQLIYPALMQETKIAKLQINEEEFEYHLDNMKNTEDFIREVKSSIRESQFKKDIIFSIARRGKQKNQAYFHRKKRANVVDGTNETAITIKSSIIFTKACGQTTEPRGTTMLLPGMYMFFNGIPNIHLGMPSPIAMLHCNLVNSNITCGEQGQVLQCVPVLTNKPHRTNRLYEPSQLSYHSIPDKSFTHIEFKFVNPDGRQRDFDTNNPEDNMLITLIFRTKYK